MQLRTDLQSRLNEPWNDVRNYEMLRDPTAMFTAMQLAATEVRANGVAPIAVIATALKTSGFVAALHEIALADGKLQATKPERHDYCSVSDEGLPAVSLYAYSRPLSLGMWLARERGVSAYLHGKGYVYQNYKEKGIEKYGSSLQLEPALLPDLANWVFENLPAARAKLVDQARRVNCQPHKEVKVPARVTRFFNNLADAPQARMDLIAGLEQHLRPSAMDAASERYSAIPALTEIIRDVTLGDPASLGKGNGHYILSISPDLYARVTDNGATVHVQNGRQDLFENDKEEARRPFFFTGPWLADFYQRWPQANSRLTSARQNLTMLGKLRFNNG